MSQRKKKRTAGALEQAADFLRASEERCRVLLEAVDVGITLIDSAFTIVTANRKQAEIVGRSPGELIGKNAIASMNCAKMSAPIARAARPWPAASGRD